MPGPRPGLILGLGLVAACGGAPPAVVPGPLGGIESAFLETRSIADKMDVARARGLSTAPLEPWYERSRQRLVGLLAQPDTTRLDPEDRRALRVMRNVVRARLTPVPPPVVGDAPAGDLGCDYDPERVAAGQDGDRALGARVMACYGQAATRIPYRGEELDRLTILGRLGDTEDPEERRRLFLALEPVWRSMNGDNGPASPWRVLLRRRVEGWRERGLPHVARARALGFPADSAAVWLERVLDAWRSAQPDTLLEPWDWYHFTGQADRLLSPRIARDRLRTINRDWYRSLGADLDALRVRFDLVPRPGKYPVAYTTFGDRPRQTGKGWWPGEPTVFASYRQGGLGNLVELLHETGHAIHIAGIRTRPAFADWPDSDTFTEAVADLASQDAFEPRWQVRVLGDSARLEASLRSKYGGVMLDVAWALFELRLFASPDQDPNRVWADLTSYYLRIRPHPEWAWWAMRGQLIDSPGYMLNYAVGAMVTAALRETIRRERGTWTEGDLGWYPWVRERLYRYGRERPVATLLQEFLPVPFGPQALLADLARAGRGPSLRLP